MARAPKHTYHHGDLRRALLDAALGLLAAQGPHGLTLREVAERVGVTPAAMYHHFRDKEALLAAVAEEGFVALDRLMTEAREAAGARPVARLRALGKGYVAFAVAHPAHFRVMFDKLVDYHAHPTLHAAADRTFASLLASICEGQKAGVVRRGSAHELSLLAWSTVHGLAMLWVGCALEGPGGEAFTIEQLTDAATEMLVRGLGKSEAPAPGRARRAAAR
ncbi:MAG: TetR/AcrR family transcriptional regulator [Byssovorax sp.]